MEVASLLLTKGRCYRQPRNSRPTASVPNARTKNEMVVSGAGLSVAEDGGRPGAALTRLFYGHRDLQRDGDFATNARARKLEVNRRLQILHQRILDHIEPVACLGGLRRVRPTAFFPKK